MSKKIIIFFIILIVLLIFIFWLKNINSIINIKLSNKSDLFIQILRENLSEAEKIFQNFQKDIARTFTTSTQEILTNEEIERLKLKIKN